MKGLILALAAFGLTLATADLASAASPDYCALYAREYAIDSVAAPADPAVLQRAQDQAYYHCLNQDEDPPLPTTSAYFGTSASVIDDASTARPARATAAATANPPTTVATAANPPPTVATIPAQAQPKPAQVASADSGSTYRSTYHGSGMTAWTPEWVAWCSANFPNSWDPKTGTILNYGADRRELCR